MARYIRIGGICILLLWETLGSFGEEADLEWQDAFVKAQAASSCEEKISLLEQSLQKNSQPSLEIRVKRTRVISGYFPFVALAEANLECGRVQEAERELKEAVSRGREIEEERKELEGRRRSRSEKALFLLATQRQERLQSLDARLAEIRRQEAVLAETIRRQEPAARLAEKPAEETVPGSPVDSSASPTPARSEESPDLEQPSIDVEPQPLPERLRPETKRETEAHEPRVKVTEAGGSRLEPKTTGSGNKSLVSPEAGSEASGTSRNPGIAASPPRMTKVLASLTIGSSLAVKCDKGSCRCRDGILTFGGHKIELPRGYGEIVINGSKETCPVSGGTSYDLDLDRFEKLIQLKNESIVAVELPDKDISPPTVWLVGILFSWPLGKPEYLYSEAGRRYDELVGLKVVRYREAKEKLLGAVEGYR